MQNIPHEPITGHIPSMRKIALGAWDAPSDPSTFTRLELDAGPIKELLSDYNKTLKIPLTTTHVIAKALGLCLEKYPNLNRVLIRHKFRQRQTISAFITVHLRRKGHIDLSGVNIDAIHTKSIAEIAEDLHYRTRALRQKEDRSIHHVQRVLDKFNTRVAKRLLRFFNFIMGPLNLNLSYLGFPKHRFGSVMITSLASLGVEEAFIPLFPPARCPFLVGIGKIVEKPVVVAGAVMVQERLPLSITFDHRHLDGYEGGQVLRYLKKVLTNPKQYMS